MKDLPLEIQDKIWNYYWQNYFYENIINYIQKKEYFFLKHIDFIKKHIIPQINNLNEKKYLTFYFHKINNYFIDLHEEKGLHLFLQKKYKSVQKNIKDINFYKNISKKFYYLFYYTICLSDQNRFYVLEGFRTLEFR